MALFGKNKFAVVSCSPEMFRGAVFGKKNSRWNLLRSGELPVAGELPGDRLKQLLKEIGYSSDTVLYLTGELAESFAFNWESVPLPQREQRGAVELELANALPGSIDEAVFQFAEYPEQDEETVAITVYAFPASSLDPVSAMLNRAGCKADEFVSPIMGIKPGEPAVVFENINPGFYFQNGIWKKAAGREDMLRNAAAWWQQSMTEKFQLPEHFEVGKFMDILLVASLECSDSSIKERPSLRVLPDQARPLRYRTQIQIAVILFVLLIINLLWSGYLHFGSDYREAQEVASEIDSCRRKITSINSRLKRNQKASRDMQRVVEIKAGESDVIGKLAALSRILPENVLVSNMRWNDSGVDLQLQSENANINLPELIKPLSFWKIGHLQQRQMWNSDVTSINLRLVPNIDKEKDLKKKGSRKYNSGNTGKRGRR